MLGPTEKGRVTDNGTLTENGYFCRLLSSFHRECGRAWILEPWFELSLPLRSWVTLVCLLMHTHLCLSFLVCKMEIIVGLLLVGHEDYELTYVRLLAYNSS